MTRSLRIFYIALFMLILTALGLWSMRSFFGFSTNPDATVLNGRWAKAVETHYDDEFPIKRLGTNIWAALDYKLFNEGRKGVVLGRDQWLYSDEEFNPIVNEELNLQGNYALVEGVRQKLKEQGVTLVMAIVPAKARLYPEHLGDVKPSSIHANLYQDFHARVAADKILAPDLLGPLQQAKQGGQQVFLRTDTHWTPEGAQVAAENLAKAIAERAPLNGEPQRFVTEPAEKITHKGDLRQFLPLDPLFEKPDASPGAAGQAQHPRSRRPAGWRRRAVRRRPGARGPDRHQLQRQPQLELRRCTQASPAQRRRQLRRRRPWPDSADAQLPQERRLQEQPATGADLGVP
nr:hypothetical protein GCM10020185_49810 [Pseudomonas brassicacearum subsp. brassicacearum]